MGDSGGLRWLRVYVRRTVEPNLVTTLNRDVYCPRTGGRTPLDACSGCGYRFAFDRHEGDERLVCDAPELDPPAASPGSDEVTGGVVGDVMVRDVVCVSPQLSVVELLRVFFQRNMQSAPVVDAGVCVGIVSTADVVRQLHLTGSSRDDALVIDVMRPSTLMVSEAMPVERAAAVLALEGAHEAPVVAGDGELVGLLTANEVLRWVARRAGYVVPTR